MPEVSKVPPVRGALPYLTIKGASDAIAFYQRVFGAEVVFRLDDPGGAVMHAELKAGPAHFMLTEEKPQYGALGPAAIGGSPVTVTLYFPDVDAVFARAMQSGAKTTMPLADQFWGDRAGGFTDPFGHHWMVASQVEQPSADEVKRRANEMFSAMKGA